MAQPQLQIGWMSHHVEGVKPLLAALDAGFPIAAIITVQDDLLAKKSGAFDYADIASKHGIPLHRIRNVNHPASLEVLDELALDVLFVIGWSQILSAEVLGKVSIGCFGAHASLLPKNRGSAPINWALINGDTQTGNTLMVLADGVDSGDIVGQEAIAITPFDNVASLYDRVADTNSNMILALLRDLFAGLPLSRTKQVDDGSPLLRRRRPEDGCMNWNQTAGDVYNFIRALTRPYPGAFSHVDGERYLIWKAALLPLQGVLAPAGTVLGPQVSDDPKACGLIVACAKGALFVSEIEDSAGKIYTGADLARCEFSKFET